MRRTVAVAAVAGIAACLAVAATAAPAAQSTICGQIKHGPYLKWTLTLPGRQPIHLHGRTWTVVATGAVPCRTAMAIGRMLLRKLPASLKTVTHRITPVPRGFSICSSESRDGNVSCYDLKHDRNVTLWQTDPLSLAQVKQIAATGAAGGSRG
jgi:hypothetical protein